MSVKVSKRFVKSLKENKTKRGILRVVKIKLEDFNKIFYLSSQIQGISENWIVKKTNATSMFGDYRIIIAKHKNGEMVCDFYFKNAKTDLDTEDKVWLKSFLLECEDMDFFSKLENLNDLE